jgi:hypothetical protein
MVKKKPSPKPALESHLAAPEGLKSNEAERKREARRKAMLAAEDARISASKSKRRPTPQGLLEDIVRVATDPECNPRWGDQAVSRERYRRFGHYPVSFVDREFGTFEHAKAVAGLVDQMGTRRLKAAISEQSRTEHAGRYLERHVRPYVHDASERAIRGTELMLSISDTHATFLDPFTWHCFLRAIQHMEPEIVVLNGDILEGAEISRHPKIPGWSVPLQTEFDFARTMFEQVRAVAPDAEVWWMAGNHGLDRLASYLSQVAPALANLHSLRFDRLAGVDDLGVKLSMGGTIASPKGTEADPEGTLFGGFYRVYHGRRVGVTPAKAELAAAQRSGQSGHTHRAQLHYATTEAGGATSWMSTPMGCTDRAGRAYMTGTTTGWQTGFGVAWLHESGRVHQYPVVTSGGVCVVEGLMIEDPGLPPTDPSRNWLPEFTIPT